MDDTVVNFKDHLKVVINNRSKRLSKNSKIGINAINKLKRLNEVSKKLLIIQHDLLTKKPSIATLDYIHWYLMELPKDAKAPIEDVLYCWVDVLLDMTVEAKKQLGTTESYTHE